MSDLAARTSAIVEADQARDAINNLVLKGDLGGLSDTEKIQYYDAVCRTVGLNPATRPFEILTLSGKKVLYPNKQCAEQLRSIRRISLSGPKITFPEGMIMVEITATDRHGRTDTDIGIVDPASGLNKSMSKADLIAKAITKAKRRVTFSICGLGFLSEVTEVEEVEGAVLEELPTAAIEAAPEYLSAEQFKELATLARSMELSDKEFAHCLRKTYPNATRAEIPAEDFDKLFEDLSDAKNIQAIKDDYASVPI